MSYGSGYRQLCEERRARGLWWGGPGCNIKGNLTMARGVNSTTGIQLVEARSTNRDWARRLANSLYCSTYLQPICIPNILHVTGFHGTAATLSHLQCTNIFSILFHSTPLKTKTKMGWS